MNHWAQDLHVLIEKYGDRKHPLDYNNRYQLMVMVILSAQDSDRHINEVAKSFFQAFPTLASLKNHNAEDLYPFLNSVMSFSKKAEWIIKIAQTLEDDDNIPKNLKELTALPGIGRKSANVIIRESGDKAEGIICDLHVLRVAPRIGVAEGTKPEKIEKQLMEAFPQNEWNALGMAISFLGREICRPKPKCEQCIVNSVCQYYKTEVLPSKA